MMVRKYQNELLVLVAFVLLLGGFVYQRGMMRKLEASLLHSQTAARQITETKTLQKVWSTKGLKKKVANLHNIVSPSKIKTFNQTKKKLTVRLENLTGKELNAITTRFASLPVQIRELVIGRSEDQYTLRCVCTW